MAKAHDVSVDSAASTLTIHELELEDDDVVEFLTDVSTEDRVEAVRRAIQVGVTAMKLLDTTQDVEFVERRLAALEDDLEDKVEEFEEELEAKVGDDGDLAETLEEHVGDDGKLSEHLEEAFGEDGPLEARLEEEIGEDGEMIRAALDPDEDGTPINRLMADMERRFESLHEKLGEREGREDVRSRSHFSGDDFEDVVREILEDMVRQTNASVAYTGDTAGAIDGRDAGDFVIELDETDQRIAVEAKSKNQTRPDIVEEMEAAIPNREADYGIFVVESLEYIPEKKVGWFEEIDREFVVVALSESDEADVEPGFLRIAYNWARLRALQSHAELGEEFDPGRLRADLDEIEDAIGRFQTIRAQCTEIGKSREKIESELTEIERDVKERLGEIAAELKKADST